MLARVKDDCKTSPVTAFGGREYIHSEWRGVPGGCELEAITHPFLDILTEAERAPEAEAPADALPEPVAEPQPEPAPKPKRGKKGGE